MNKNLLYLNLLKKKNGLLIYKIIHIFGLASIQVSRSNFWLSRFILYLCDSKEIEKISDKMRVIIRNAYAT